MNEIHRTMIVLAYALTFGALAIELLLLHRHRQQVLATIRTDLLEDDSPASSEPVTLHSSNRPDSAP